MHLLIWARTQAHEAWIECDRHDEASKRCSSAAALPRSFENGITCHLNDGFMLDCAASKATAPKFRVRPSELRTTFEQ